MEQQLAEYRAQRQARAGVDASKKHLLGKTSINAIDDTEHSDSSGTSIPVNGTTPKSSINEKLQHSILHHPEAKIQGLSKTDCYINRARLAIKWLLWLILMILFVKLEFGAVFFVISCLYLIWTNLRSGPKKEGELSAYSVFNPNFETIEGTLTAEQFEREIKFGSASVR